MFALIYFIFCRLSLAILLIIIDISHCAIYTMYQYRMVQKDTSSNDRFIDIMMIT